MVLRSGAVRVVVAAVLAGACGGGGAATPAGGSGGASSGGSAEPASNSANLAPEGAGEHRSGLMIHVQNMTAEGNLPEEAAPHADRLHVTFELDLQHNGTEPLRGITISRARLVHDDGREIVFGVQPQGWDGTLAVGAHQVVRFEKTPDSASPPPSRSFCGVPMRIEVTLDLAGRQARATSRRVTLHCPPTSP